jgi:hypothetical protein
VNYPHGTAELDLTPGPAHWLVRKRPVEVEAMHLRHDNFPEVARWCRGQELVYTIPALGRVLDIATLEGVMHAEPGDWIVKGVEGEFYPVKPEIFRKTYEAIKALA